MDSNQPMRALELANRKRIAVAKAKRQVREGSRSLESVLRDPVCGSAKVAQVIQAQRQWGPQRTAALMAQFGISHLRRVEDLTERQIDGLVRAAQLPSTEWWTVQRRVAA
jgi:hypothetical protein